MTNCGRSRGAAGPLTPLAPGERGLTTVDALFVFASAAYNIKRIVTLRAAAA